MEAYRRFGVAQQIISNWKRAFLEVGHAPETKSPGKTEYPKDWTPEITREAVEYVLNTPNYSFTKGSDEIFFQGSYRNVVIEVRYDIDKSPKRNPDRTKVHFVSAYPIGSTDESVIWNSETKPVVSRVLKRPHGEYKRKWLED